MKPASNPIHTARQAVSRERASEIRLLTPNPPANKPTPTSHLETHPPSRRRVVNRKIKAQPAKFPRP